MKYGLRLHNFNKSPFFSLTDTFIKSKISLSNIYISKSFAPFIHSNAANLNSLLISNSKFEKFVTSAVTLSNADLSGKEYTTSMYSQSVETGKGGTLQSVSDTRFINCSFVNITNTESSFGALAINPYIGYYISLGVIDCKFENCVANHSNGRGGAIFCDGYQRIPGASTSEQTLGPQQLFSVLIQGTSFINSSAASTATSIYLSNIENVTLYNCSFTGDTTQADDASMISIDCVHTFSFDVCRFDNTSMPTNSYIFALSNSNTTQTRMQISISYSCFDTPFTIFYVHSNLMQATINLEHNDFSAHPSLNNVTTESREVIFIDNGNLWDSDICYMDAPPSSETENPETPPPPATSDNSVTGNAGLTTGAIVGIVIAVLVVLIIIVILIILFCRKDNRKAYDNNEDPTNVDGFNPTV